MTASLLASEGYLTSVKLLDIGNKSTQTVPVDHIVLKIALLQLDLLKKWSHIHTSRPSVRDNAMFKTMWDNWKILHQL